MIQINVFVNSNAFSNAWNKLKKNIHNILFPNYLGYNSDHFSQKLSAIPTHSAYSKGESIFNFHPRDYVYSVMDYNQEHIYKEVPHIVSSYTTLYSHYTYNLEDPKRIFLLHNTTLYA